MYNGRWLKPKDADGKTLKPKLTSDISQFIDEFTTVLSNIHANCKQSYINVDYNIDLLKLLHNAHYNTLYEL